MTVQQPSVRDQATSALARHAWPDAHGLLAAADARGELAPDELELLAQAAWWMGMLPAAIDARERAYAAATKSGDVVTAVIAAITLGRDNLYRGTYSVANAWLNRAERLRSTPRKGLVMGGWRRRARSTPR